MRNNCHNLKTWPGYFEDIYQGRKKFEIRKNDRDFQTGDCLELREWDPVYKRYTGRYLRCDIIYIFSPDDDYQILGIKSGYCVLGIKINDKKYPYLNIMSEYEMVEMNNFESELNNEKT